MTDEPGPPRGALALLRDPMFGGFLGGKVVSTCGMWVQNIAAAVLMYDLTGSNLMVGAVSTAQFVPMLLFSLWAGALTDRIDRRRLLIAGRVMSGVTVVMLATLLLVRGTKGFGGEAVLLVAVFLAGTGWALSMPPMQAMVPALVPARDLEQALALNAVAPSLGRTIGPALGAGLLVLGGPALAFAVAGPAHLAFAVILLAIKPRAAARPSARVRILGGFRYLRADRKAAMLMLGGAAVSFGADPVLTLTPALAAGLGGGDETVGLFATAFGVGAVIAVVALRPLRKVVTLRPLGVYGFWVLAAGLVVVALSPAVGSATAGFVVAGTGFILATVVLTTRIQRRVPDELRGRVMALWGLAFLGTRPAAALLDGLIADAVNVQAAVLTAAVITLISSLLARVSYVER
nr:MFS transporter [Blastococcus saxobsidens]